MSTYDILFEPVKIGPVTAPNRFYQVPHCNGLGHRAPKALAAMRGIKAQGGWGCVCTEEVEIHPSSEISPYIEGRLWDDADIPNHQLVTAAIHQHGALAGIELVYNGMHAPNHISRLPPMAPSARPVDSYDPVHARAMDLSDIKNLRNWHIAAAKRAKAAGYNIIYAYAGHSMSGLMHFLQKRNNHRTDEYGGSLENRTRLIAEILTGMKEAVGDTCAIAFRLSVDELIGKDGIEAADEAHDIVAQLAELPDLWDVNISGWTNDSATARFEPNEGYQDRYTSFVKSLTTKPVVGVGRFTDPDAMVARIKQGKLDLIGAARPSIADPFLPEKIRAGRLDEIRECIGCNICVASDNLCIPIRCTQNPTMGEEWRRNWHPENAEPAPAKKQVLIIGGGPSGLECALHLAKRGYQVALAEQSNQLGGRLKFEASLPGLASYDRVRTYRENLLRQMANVEVYLDSEMGATDCLAFGADHIILATGATWLRTGTGREHQTPITGLETASILTPDDIAKGNLPSGNVLIYDDDHYLLGGVLAEYLTTKGCTVTLGTPAAKISAWTENTLEQEKIQSRLAHLGVTLRLNARLEKIAATEVQLASTYAPTLDTIPIDHILMVTARTANDVLCEQLQQDNCPVPITRIGDCLAPGTIASAVYLGHLAAHNLDGDDWHKALFTREIQR